VKKLLLIIFIAMLAAQPVFASSKSLQELTRERQSIQNAIRSTQSDLNSTRNEMFRVNLAILDLDEKLLIALEELEIIEKTLEETVARLNQTELELDWAREERDNQFWVFKERLRVMHEFGPVSFLDVLLNSTSVRDFLVRLEFVNNIAKYDQEMVDRMQAAEDRVAVKVEEIARQRNTVEALQYAQTAKTREIESTLAEQHAYYEKLYADDLLFEAKLAQQRETERGIQALYQQELAAEQERERQRRAAMPEPSGPYLWPVPSSTTISSHYGYRSHPLYRRREFHTGVDISARMGTDIRASHSGTVIVASRQGAYGNTVIIDHGGGISTVYAHASKILVSVGQQVDRGHVIAHIGSTGVSTGPHLHFEVRRNGQHMNPKPYLGY
jgi:murein DD-endopeptidase MepM/ murein hydrolase activator NlpD